MRWGSPPVRAVVTGCAVLLWRSTRSRVRSGSASNALAWATNARCAVGHDTPWTVASSATERAASPIAAPIWVRSRPVVRVRAGTCSMDSVKEPRSQ
jgi:hypothetical protein